MKRGTIQILAALLTLVWIRLLLAVFYFDTPIPIGPISDSWIYFGLGRWFGATGTMPAEAVFHPPLYPYLLGWIFRRFGPSPIPVLALQSLAGITWGLIVIRWTQRWAERSWMPWVTLGVLVFSATPVVMMEWRLLPETFALLAEVAAIEALWQLQKGTWPNLGSVIVSLIMAFLILLRPNFVLAVPIVWIWGFREHRKGRVSLGFFAWNIVVLAIVTAPIVARNHGWGAGIALSANSGITFYQGNNPAARGGYTQLPGVDSDVTRQNEDARRQSGEGDLQTSDHHWWREGATFLAGNPGRAALLALRKGGLFVNPTEPGGDIPFLFERQRLPVLYPLGTLNFTVLLLLAIVAVRFGRKKKTPWGLFAGWGAVSFATCMLFYVNGRYRLPIWPILVFLSVLGLEEGVKRRKEPVVWLVLLALPAMIWIGWRVPTAPRTQVTGWHNWGTAWEHFGFVERALPSYRNALAIDPGHRPTLENMSRVYLAVPRIDRAKTVLTELITRHPDSFVGHNNLAVVYLLERTWDEAISEATIALRLRPGNKAAEFNLRRARELKSISVIGRRKAMLQGPISR
ncbi:MAG: hypothetical protein V1495_03270 [Pseudomonadota bacterium]